MGMYTQLKLNVTFKEDTPHYVFDILDYMLYGDGGNEARPLTPQHPLFETYRWTWMLVCSSAYFDEGSSHTFEERHLAVVCDFKNYGNELEYFLDWIMPYVYDDPGTVLGYHRYEEDAEPTTIYKV